MKMTPEQMLGYLQDPKDAKKYASTFGLEEAADAAGENSGRNPHNSLENVKAPWGKTMADGKEGKSE